MKKIFILGFLFVSLGLMAQLPVSTKVKTLSPALVPGGITTLNSSKYDTLKTGDTLFYKVLINHDEIGYPYLSLLLKRVAGADTATVTATFWQSVDGSTNWQQVKYLSKVTTFLFDTTKFAGSTTGTSTLLFDTTKYSAGVYRHDFYSATLTGKGRQLYSATGTSANTETAWTVSLTKAIMKGGTTVSFWRNNAAFESQYLGIRFISAVSSGFKGIYYGSVRYDNK